MNFEEEIKATYKEVTENLRRVIKNLKSELKEEITTPSKRRREISKSVEKVRRNRRPTLYARQLL